MRYTGNAPDYIRHTYKVLKVLKSYTVFKLQELDGNNNLLTDSIRIEEFRGKSSATNIDNYLRLRNTSNWSKCKMITGLRPTKINGLFYGDMKQTDSTVKTLLLFLFYDHTTLFIDVYKDFYPHHKGILQNIISTY